MTALASVPLRRLPVPDTAPPLEIVAAAGPWCPPGTQPAASTRQSVQGTLHLMLGDAIDDDTHHDTHDHDAPTGRPDPQQWSRRLVQVIVEVMSGHRAATQLLRWTTPAVYERVRSLTLPPPRPGARPGRQRPVVRSVRVCEPADGVAEVSAVVLGEHRAHALAVRLEGRDARWRVTALECG